MTTVLTGLAVLMESAEGPCPFEYTKLSLAYMFIWTRIVVIIVYVLICTQESL
jgi:hypothetical protein